MRIREPDQYALRNRGLKLGIGPWLRRLRPFRLSPLVALLLNFLRVFDGAVDERGGNIKNCESFFKMLYKILLVIPYVPFQAGLME